MCQIIFSSIIKINNYRVSNLMTSWHYFCINILYSRNQTIFYLKKFTFNELYLILSIHNNLSTIHFDSHRIISNVFNHVLEHLQEASAFIYEINQTLTRYELLIVSSHATICLFERTNNVSTLLIAIIVCIQLISKVNMHYIL